MADKTNKKEDFGEQPKAYSVFIVEDEAIVADDLKETLGGLGHTVAGSAGKGEAAVERILAAQPEIVLMDIHLTGEMDGVDVAEAIHRTLDVPIIYLTAYADRDLLVRARRTQPYGYLIKPFDERELQSAIEMAGFKHAMDRQLKESRERLQQLNEELEARVAERTESLHRQVLLLQQLIDTIPAPVYYKDTGGVYLGCNHAFETYTGIRKHEIAGRTDAALFPSDMAGLATEKDAELLNRRGIQVYQTRFPHADHTLRDVIFKKATFQDGGGGIAGFIGVMIDISDRARYEEALRESEERFYAVASDMAELVYRCTPESTCTYANPAFLSLFGRAAEETIGHIFVLPVPDDDLPRLRQHLSLLSQDQPAGEIDLVVLLPDGSSRGLHWRIRAFFDPSGTVREYQYIGSGTGPSGI